MTTNRSIHFALTAPLLLGLALTPAIGCSAGDGTSVEEVGTHGMSYEEFLSVVYQEPETGFYIVNGDELIETEAELEDFYVRVVQSDALIVHRVNNTDAKWSDAQKVNLTYCISTQFGANHTKVKNAMANATAAWHGAANVKFVYNSAQDGNCTASNNNVVFDIRPVNANGQYLARAFFPNNSRSARNVLIDGSAFGNLGTWTLDGVLRHELGHTLGFRHEHTRPEAGTCFEDNSWRALTTYDSNSVMHYPQCNGTQQGDLVLTQKDKDGAKSLYGAPGGGAVPVGCAHDVCSLGAASQPLANGCDPCVTTVCQSDSWCCSNDWDQQCKDEAVAWCGKTCP